MANIENTQINSSEPNDNFLRNEEREGSNGEMYEVEIREDSNGNEYTVAKLTPEQFSKFNH